MGENSKEAAIVDGIGFGFTLRVPLALLRLRLRLNRAHFIR